MNYNSVNATHELVKYALWFAPGKSRKSLLLKILFQTLFPSSSLSLFPFLCSALQIFFSSKNPPNCYPFSSLSPSPSCSWFFLSPLLLPKEIHIYFFSAGSFSSKLSLAATSSSPHPIPWPPKAARFPGGQKSNHDSKIKMAKNSSSPGGGLQCSIM